MQLPGSLLGATSAWGLGTKGSKSIRSGQDSSHQFLTVVIVGARGLRNSDWGVLREDKSDPYCICTIPGKDASKDDFKIRTRVINDCLDPVWNHEAVMENWEPGDPLTFTVYDKDFGKADDVLGRATILSTQFDQRGFSGDLPLMDAGKNRAFVTVRICFGKPMWSQDSVEQAAMAATTETEVLSMKTRRRNQRLGVSMDKRGMTRQQFREFLLVERARIHYCATLPFTLAMLIAFGWSAWCHGYIGSTGRIQSGIGRALNDLRVPRTLSDGTRGEDLTLASLTNSDEMWHWMSAGLVPRLGGDPVRPGYFQSFNKVLGKLQLTQSRLKVAECSKLSAELADYFSLGCRSGDVSKEDYGPTPEAGTNFTKDAAFVAGSKLGGAPLISKDSYYAFVEPMPVVGATRLAELWQGHWVDDATEWMEARVALFNGEVSIFTELSLRFSFQQGGLVDRELEVRAVPIAQWTTWDLVASVCFGLLMLFLLLGNVQEVLDRKARRKAEAAEREEQEEDEDEDEGCLRCCWPCARRCGLFFGDFWLSVDWAGLALGAGIIALFLVQGGIIGHLGSQFGKLEGVSLPERPIGNATVEDHSRYDEGLRDLETATALVLRELRLAVDWKSTSRILMFCFTFYLLLRLFRGCLGQPYFAEMIKTIKEALPDIVHLSMILAITFENFVLSGCLFFGGGLKDWSTINDSHRAALGLLSGMGDFASMYEVYPVAAVVWLFLFAVVIVFVSANMLLAIMVDHYGEAKKEFSQARQSLPAQTLFLLQDLQWKGLFNLRRAVRFLQGRYPRVRDFTPYLDEEEPRVKHIPFDAILEALEPAVQDESADPHAVVRSISQAMAKKSKVPAWTKGQPIWAPMQGDVLLACGCDASTAGRLLSKCDAIVQGRRPNEFPADLVYHEFTGQMKNVYDVLCGTDEDLRLWLSQRRVDCDNLEPRQRKFEELALEKIMPRPREDEPMLLPAPQHSPKPGRSNLMLGGPDKPNRLTQ